MNYKVIEHKEILHELFAGLLADFDNIMTEQQIDTNDTANLFVILSNQANTIWLDILGDKYSTMDDMMRLKGKYELLHEYLEKIK